MRVVLALALGSLLCAISAHADEFAIYGGMFANQLAPLTQSDGTIINCPCGPTVESFQTSFNFDTVSQSVTEMNINSNGPLGPFSFAGVTTNGVPTNPAVDFTWSSSLASIIFNVYDRSFVDGFLPDHSLVLTCLSAECVNDFGGVAPTYISDLGTGETAASIVDLGPSSPPAPTPEPSSLLLMGVGLIGIAFTSRRLMGVR